MLKMGEMVLDWFPHFKANKRKPVHKPKTDLSFLRGHVLRTEFISLPGLGGRIAWDRDA